jgi:predicted MFS family arabinose efflux permease
MADRFPKRRVMVGCDAVRLVLALGVAAWASGPLWWLLGAFTLLTLAEPPFEAARAALMPDLLDEGAYVAGHSILQTSLAVCSAAGFAVGGVVASAFGLRGAMIADALTFAASGLAVLLNVPEPGQLAHGQRAPQSTKVWRAMNIVRAYPRLRWLLIVASGGAACVVAADGLAVAIAGRDGRGAASAGVLAAAPLVGAVVAAAAHTTHLNPIERAAAIRPLACLCAGALATCVLNPGYYVTVAAFALAGTGSTFQLLANQEYVLAVPAEARGAAFGLASAVVTTASAASVLIAGLVSDYVEPVRVVGGTGCLALIGLLVLGGFKQDDRRQLVAGQPRTVQVA